MADLFGAIPLEDDKERPFAVIEWTGTMRDGTFKVVVPQSVPQAMRADVMNRVLTILEFFKAESKDRTVTLGEDYAVPTAGTFAGLFAIFDSLGAGFGLYIDGPNMDWPDDPEAGLVTEAYETASLMVVPDEDDAAAIAAARTAWWEMYGDRRED